MCRDLAAFFGGWQDVDKMALDRGRDMKNILLLEDDESLNRGISFKLEKESYQVFAASTLEEGYRLFEENPIQLVICDIMLKDGSGLEFCKTIRKTSSVRFLFLTAMDEEIDVVMGYEAGADDYMTKPFSLAVLLSKVAAVFKRLGEGKSERLESGRICFFVQEMKVSVAGEETVLTKNEWKLLKLFMENPRQILSKRQILSHVFDMEGEFVDENTLAVNIKRLREKIEEDSSKPVYIKNIRGIGYLWDKECSRGG